MRTVGSKLLAANAGVGLRGILHRQQIVADGDGRQENGNKDRESNNASPPASAVLNA